MMRSRNLSISLALGLALGALSAGGPGAARAVAVADPVPASPTKKLAWTGRLVAPVVARAAPRKSAKRRMVLQPIAPFAQGPTTLLITRSVVKKDVRWVEVYLPKRPNGSRGWIPADVLSLSTTPVRVLIDLGDRRLTVYRKGRRAFSARIAVGAAATPTPRGRYFAIAETVRTGVPGAFLGPLVLPLTGFSETLNEFAGGNGRVAIHGTSLPALIGSAVSHGCIRMRNKDIVRVAAAARAGTPVSIRG